MAYSQRTDAEETRHPGHGASHYIHTEHTQDHINRNNRKHLRANPRPQCFPPPRRMDPHPHRNTDHTHISRKGSKNPNLQINEGYMQPLPHEQ